MHNHIKRAKWLTATTVNFMFAFVYSSAHIKQILILLQNTEYKINEALIITLFEKCTLHFNTIYVHQTFAIATNKDAKQSESFKVVDINA